MITSQLDLLIKFKNLLKNSTSVLLHGLALSFENIIGGRSPSLYGIINFYLISQSLSYGIMHSKRNKHSERVCLPSPWHWLSLPVVHRIIGLGWRISEMTTTPQKCSYIVADTVHLYNLMDYGATRLHPRLIPNAGMHWIQMVLVCYPLVFIAYSSQRSTFYTRCIMTLKLYDDFARNVAWHISIELNRCVLSFTSQVCCKKSRTLHCKLNDPVDRRVKTSGGKMRD